MDINLSQIDLDLNNVGNWPIAIKAVAIVMLCSVILGAGFYLDTQDMLAGLESARKVETDLKKEFETKQAKAASLDAYKAQMVEMEESFGTMLRQLPSKTEVADLLVDITQSGLASGLDFELFEPKNEVPQEFYAELPISIRVIGNYHEFGHFVSGVAALPRIVTLHDIAIRVGTAGNLTMDAVAKTYRYLDDQEVATGKKANR